MSRMQLTTIDCQYVFPQFAASYLLTYGGRASFVETNTTKAVPHLLKALASQKLKPENVDFILVTHAHLDHAGGTAALLAHCPNAKVVCHPKAAKTLSDPAKLVASARQVYGDAAFEALYGSVDPIDLARIHPVADGETLEWQGQLFRFWHTDGHASHHMCIDTPALNGVFTGDAFGIGYQQLQGERPFVFPSTSPIDFDPELAKASIERVIRCGRKRVFLTHYGVFEDPPYVAQDLLVHLAAHTVFFEMALKDPEIDLLPLIRQYFKEQVEARGFAFDEKVESLLKIDIDLNAQGLTVAAKRRLKKLAERSH